ncbi:MAG: hypothetical protein [Circular genetic element sp.]|nr:MAG: hypothetical protein [Circular genetic element sp.]
MKSTGRTMTLSGQMPKRLFGAGLHRDPYTILEYANVLDISKAWKLLDFKCWIQEDSQNLGAFAEPFQFGLDVQLATDVIPDEPMWNNAGDNRAVGFGTLTYYVGDGQYKPAISFTGASRMLMHESYWMKDDHVIQNRLDISAAAKGNNTVESLEGYTLNYIVNLEEIDITATESIVYNIKSKAQDLS